MDILSGLPDIQEVKGNTNLRLKEVSPVLLQSCTRVIVGDLDL